MVSCILFVEIVQVGKMIFLKVTSYRKGVVLHIVRLTCCKFHRKTTRMQSYAAFFDIVDIFSIRHL